MNEGREQPEGGEPNAAKGPVGYLLLAAAVVVFAGVLGYFLLAGGEEEAAPAFPDNGLPFGGTPLSALSGVTPPAGTGVLEPQRPEIGERAPDFALRDVRERGVVRKLSDYRGKVVVLNWYASWCGPCKEEIPDFEKAYKALGGDVVVLGVNLLETPEKALGILQETGGTYPAVLDESGVVTDHYRVGTGLPKTYFIDRDGVLRSIQAGTVRPADLERQLGAMGVTYRAGQ